MTSHKHFKRAAGLMLVAVLASRLLGLVREMLIARQFGSTGVVSAYYAAFNLPDLLYFFLSSGALSSAFIPEFTKRFETGKKREAWEVFSIIACFMGLVLLAAVVIFWVYAKPLVSILAVPGFVTRYPELVPLTVLLTRIILPCQLFFFLGGLMSATLESRQKFAARAAGPVIYNLGIILGAVALAKWFNIAGLAFGTLVGAFVGNVVYTFYCMRKEGYSFYPSLNLRHPGVVRVAKLALPVIFGLGLPQIDVIVNRWFASFVSASAPADLNFANRLMQVPLGIFAQAAGTAILPMLSAYAAKNALSDMRSGVSYGLRGIMVESLPATAFMVVMADPLVRAIYMGGEFKPSSVAPVALLLIWYSVGIFAWAGQRIVAPGFFALQDTLTPVVIGTVSTVIFIPLNVILMKSMGAPGIALATTIGITLHFVGMSWVLRKRLHGLEGAKMIRTIGLSLVAAVLMGAACFGVRMGMSQALGAWQLQDGDISNPTALAEKLERDNHPLSGFIYSEVGDKTRKLIDDDQQAAQLAPDIRVLLVGELNRILQDDSLYQSDRFARILLPSDVKQSVRQRPSQEQLIDLNRRLIESAYLDTISRRQGKTMSDRMQAWLRRMLEDPRLNEANRANSEPGAFTESDIVDVARLAIQIVDPCSLEDRPVYEPVSKHILSGLSTSARQRLVHFATVSKSSAAMPESLMRDLNTLISRRSIYSPERFKGVALPRHIIALEESDPKGERLIELNRRLLEHVYSGDIVVRPVSRVESRMGSALTVLVAMVVGGVVYFALLRLFKVDEMDYLWSALRRKLFGRRSNGRQEDLETLDQGESMD